MARIKTEGRSVLPNDRSERKEWTRKTGLVVRTGDALIRDI